MKGVAAVLAVLVALALQTTVGGFEIRGTAVLDLVLTVLVYLSLTFGPVVGMLTATIAGLIQDSLSSGILGIGGLAKTLVAFLAGIASTQFILNGSLQRFFTFFLATLAHAAIFMGLYAALDLRHFSSPVPAVLAQAFGNGVVGVVGFRIVEWLPGFLARRRAARPLSR